MTDKIKIVANKTLPVIYISDCDRKELSHRRCYQGRMTLILEIDQICNNKNDANIAIITIKIMFFSVMTVKSIITNYK